jgi:hypothetical protein
VAVEEVIDGKVTRKAYFTPVVVTKDSGFFPAREHWVYRADFTVKSSTDYRLVVYIEEYDRIIYSTCYTVGDFDIINPLYPVVRPIQMQADHPLSFYWTRSENSAIYQLGFVMHYLETRDEETLFKDIVIPLKSIFLESSDNLYSYPVNSTNFYGYLARHLPVDTMVLRRCLSIDAMVISGGDELGFYMRLQEAGQTFSLMDYTNISNGIGIFSSRVIRRVNGFSLTEQSIDTLAYGHLTKALNFVDRTGSRNGG